MKLNKKGAMTEKTIETWIVVFVLVLVLFKVIADVFPDVTAAATDLTNAGFPLASFFATDGVMWYLVAVALLVMIYKAFKNKAK